MENKRMECIDCPYCDTENMICNWLCINRAEDDHCVDDNTSDIVKKEAEKCCFTNME